MISVIVPVYNAEKYLCKCVESILNQTYKDIEILLIDDGSVDNSAFICDKFRNDYPDLIKTVHKENGGLSSARNIGLDLASGDYVCFVDSDDWIEDTMLESMIGVFNCTCSDIVCCNFYYAINKGESISCEEFMLPVEKGKIETYNRKEYLSNFSKYAMKFLIISWNKLYKKQIFKSLKFREGYTCEDEIIFHDILFCSNNISVINEPLYYYYQSNNSITRNKDAFKKNIVGQLLAYVERVNSFKNTEFVFSYNSCMGDFVSTILLNWNIIKDSNRDFAKKQHKFLLSIRKEINKNPLLSIKTKLLTNLFMYNPDFMSYIFKFIIKGDKNDN